MHLLDGFVSGPINTATGLVAAGCVHVAMRQVQDQLEERTVPLLGTTAAFVFAAQMINFPVAGGVSGHFLGGVFAAIMLGPAGALLVMTVILLLQCLLFADGGLTALGTNIMNLGLIGCVGGFIAFRAMRMLLPNDRLGFLMSAAAAAWLSVVLSAGACAIELAASGTVQLNLVLPALIGVHAVIGIGEALITWLILSMVLLARPDLLDSHGPARTLVAAGRLS